MPERLRLLAPAKINLTLEVIARRADGYHEVATVMQTITLCDVVTLETADEITLAVTGEAAAGSPADAREDLAYRAAARMSSWLKESRGVRIAVDKAIPAGMGLGGGSSDAAAVLRGLNQLWELGRENASLCRLAAELGSDVPFFVYGGSALCRGRGERVDPQVDAQASPVTLFLPSETLPSKTAAMYSRLDRSDDSAGVATRGVIGDIVMAVEVSGLRNVFDRHVEAFGEKLPVAIDACTRAGFEVHLAGSGPAFFALRPKAELPARELALMEYLGIEVRECSFLAREDALRVTEL